MIRHPSNINTPTPNFINNTLAHNLMSPPPFFQQNHPNINFPQPTTAQTQNMPYSISVAHRNSTMYNNFNQLSDPKVGHNSRIGEVMYDETNGITERQKARQTALSQPRQSLGWLPLLLPGVIILFLFIFVISCIVKHRGSPFSENSLKFFDHHPEWVSAFSVKDTDFTEALLKEKLNPTVTITTPDREREYQELVNQNINQANNIDQIHKENQLVTNLNNLQHPHSNLNTNLENITTYPNQLTPQPDNIPIPQLSEQSGNECQQGYYLLNGVCYPCKNGYWNGTHCITKGLAAGLINNNNNTTPTNPVVQNISSLINSINTDTNTDAVHRNQNNRSVDINFVNGKVKRQQSRCPADSIWNGTECQKIGGNHYYYHKWRHMKRRA